MCFVEKAPEQRIVGAVVAGKYRIRRIIGAGSMGVVCEAEHLEIGKRLAIKVIDASLAGMSDIATRFRREARAASLVESQHIVQVFDVGTDEALGLYLVMEHLTGEDLSARLAREKRLPADVAVRIALQVARALAKAHEAGVVHRDLKPANIFLCEREDDPPLVKILDFGISKVIDASRAESTLALTRAGTVVGTPQYMSPEQARGERVDEKTDVWALGLVLYEMLAGRPAYPELPTYEAFIILLASHPPDPLRTVAPWVPEGLADLVHHAIEHDAARRPGCSEVLLMLLDQQTLSGANVSALEAPDTGDTWAEPALLPYRLPRSAPEDSLTIDIDVPPDPTLLGDVADPPPPFGPLSRSGVREAAEDAPDDSADDLLEFFDRRTLEGMQSRSSSVHAGVEGGRAAWPVAGARWMDAPVHVGQATASPSVSANGGIDRPDRRRHPLRWMALVFVALGLGAVVAHAFSR